MRKIITFSLVAMFMVGMMGMPALHGTDGKGFGKAVSGLAKTNPFVLVSHVSGR